MKTLEKVCIVFITIGLFSKFFHFPGGSFLTLISCLILSGAYNFFGFIYHLDVPFKRLKETEKSSGDIAIGILSGFAFALAVLGIVFKIQHFPGAMIMILSSIVLLVPIIIYLIVKKKTAINTFIRASILCGLCTFLYLFPLSLEKVIHRNNPAYLESLEKLQKDPNNYELRRKTDSLRFPLYDLNHIK